MSCPVHVIPFQSDNELLVLIDCATYHAQYCAIGARDLLLACQTQKYILTEHWKINDPTVTWEMMLATDVDYIRLGYWGDLLDTLSDHFSVVLPSIARLANYSAPSFHQLAPMVYRNLLRIVWSTVDSNHYYSDLNVHQKNEYTDKSEDMEPYCYPEQLRDFRSDQFDHNFVIPIRRDDRLWSFDFREIKKYWDTIRTRILEEFPLDFKAVTGIFSEVEASITKESAVAKQTILVRGKGIAERNKEDDGKRGDKKAADAFLSSIVVSHEPPQVTIKGEAYAVKPTAATLMQAIVEARGEWINGHAVVDQPSRDVAAMPDQVRKWIEASPGKGYRLRRKQ